MNPNDVWLRTLEFCSGILRLQIHFPMFSFATTVRAASSTWQLESRPELRSQLLQEGESRNSEIVRNSRTEYGYNLVPRMAAKSAPLEEDQFDVIVLGAGVSGLVSALEITKSGYRVCLIEDYPDPGGNHRSVEIDDATFDIGAIFFWSNNLIFDYFPTLRDQCVPVNYGVTRVNPSGKVVAYPYSVKEEFFSMSFGEICKAILGLLIGKFRNFRFRTADDYIKYYLGAYLSEKSGISNYIRRFYGVEQKEISSELAQKRMGWIASNAGIRNKLGKLFKFPAAGETHFSATCLARPKDGFGSMYSSALNTLRAAGCQVILNASVSSIQITEGEYRVRTRLGIRCSSRLVNTFPLRKIGNLVGLSGIVPPESTTMLTLFCRFSGRRNFPSLIFYNFHKCGLWKRLTMHSDYYGKAGEMEFFSVEATFKGSMPPESVVFQDFVRHTKSISLFDGEIELVGSTLTEYAYPIYQLGYESKRDSAISAIQALGIDLVGRQGAFDYMPAADFAVKAAVDLVSRRFCGYPVTAARSFTEL